MSHFQAVDKVYRQTTQNMIKYKRQEIIGYPQNCQQSSCLLLCQKWYNKYADK